MNVEIKEGPKESKDYPWIGIDKDGDLCIFVKPGEGLLIYSDGDLALNIPEAIAAVDEHNFEKFRGTVTLSNHWNKDN